MTTPRHRGRRVLITGGASGIGAATVARFLAEGGRVCILDADAGGCERMQQQHPELAGFVQADVADREQVEAGLAGALDLLGGIDVLINNAGISVRHAFLDIDPDDFHRVLDVNLAGVFHVAQLTARHMVAGGGGAILNTASTSGLRAYPWYADYNASKAGVIGLTLSMAIELAPKVRVNAIAPGYVLTPMQRREYSDEMLAAVNAKIPLGRHATPEEIAGLFAYLASDEAAYVTGQVFVIDGGEIAAGLAGGG